MAPNNRPSNLDTLSTLNTPHGSYSYYRLPTLEENNIAPISRLPFSIKVLLEAALRNENGKEVTYEDVLKIARYNAANPGDIDVPFHPARVLLQDFTGVPAVVDLAAMRSAMTLMGGDAKKINPLIPVDLVIDHSVQVDHFASAEALEQNSELEFSRNQERYQFLRWGQKAFKNFRVVPPASGIVHQVNLEYLAPVVQQKTMPDGKKVLYPDSLVGTDSHTTMINGLGVVGWGVGGIEAEAVMLGQPIYMLLPEVIGFKLTGRLPAGANATDLVLTVTEILRKKGVVNKFVEFCGPALSQLSLADRATVANMAPEYGATLGFFPVDHQTIDYMRRTGRDAATVDLVEAYYRAQGMWRDDQMPLPMFKDMVELDLSTVQPCLAGPKRPQDRVVLSAVKDSWHAALTAPVEKRGFALKDNQLKNEATVEMGQEKFSMHHGDVVISAITSCTNTSNPSVLLSAGLLAKKAVEAGLRTKPWVKTSLAPGSKVVTDYLERSGLLPYLEKLGFHVVGYGCTTCIGNSGPLPEPIARGVEQGQIVAAAVLSGNRNFEGRVNPHTRANYLASPPLCVAYALAGTMALDLTTEPIGAGKDGRPVFLKDIWPTDQEIDEKLKLVNEDSFKRSYQGIEQANEKWNRIEVKGGENYQWNEKSTYIQEPPFFLNLGQKLQPISAINEARVLAKFGDSITTDHISPAGNISPKTPAGKFLLENGVAQADFNSYGSRRGNDRVMTRGTFANIRLKNLMVEGVEGGVTIHLPTGEQTSIYEAAMRYQQARTPLIILAGNDYGMGSSRDWAAKGTLLLGVQAVIAQSFERIHRSNLVGMGILPLQFEAGQNAATLNLTGQEIFTIKIDDAVKPRQKIEVLVRGADGQTRTISTTCRIDTPVEVEYYRQGGILPTVLRRLLSTKN